MIDEVEKVEAIKGLLVMPTYEISAIEATEDCLTQVYHRC
jgi:hypothetical protein